MADRAVTEGATEFLTTRHIFVKYRILGMSSTLERNHRASLGVSATHSFAEYELGIRLFRPPPVFR